jgi:hypothetical protein
MKLTIADARKREKGVNRMLIIFSSGEWNLPGREP